MNEQMIIKSLQTFFSPDDVFEVRVLNAVRNNSSRTHTESGFFDYAHIIDIPACLSELKSYSGAYFTINPCNPALLARRSNKLDWAKRGELASDADILMRRWLYIDIDAERPAGICATEEEKDCAKKLCDEVDEGMKSLGWNTPIKVDSGNGYSLYYCINLPSKTDKVKALLTSISKASTDTAHVDPVVYNSARICRIPGTLNCKGEDTKERPHRPSKLLYMPSDISPNTDEQIDAIIAEVVSCEPIVHQPIFHNDNVVADDFNSRGEIEPILDAHGWTFISEDDGNQVWRRPGKTEGQSATYNGDCFYVFSSAAHPFVGSVGYSRFGVYAMLECGNDFGLATRKLKQMGYGFDQSDDPYPNIDLSLILGMKAEAPPPIAVVSGNPGEFPEELLNVPGFINKLIDYSLKTAPYPNRVLSFCGALCMQSFLSARKSRDEYDNRSNIYVMALANSGVGKDHPRKINVKLASKHGLLDSVADAFASGEGIEDAVFINYSMLFQTDEIDTIIGSLKSGGDPRSESIMQILLKMYSSSNTIYPRRKKAGVQQTEPIDSPSLTLFGTAVPQYFYKSLTARMMNNGLFARTLIVDAGSRSRGNKPSEEPIPEDLMKIVEWWAGYNPGVGVTCGEKAKSPSPIPRVVPTTTEADEFSELIWGTSDDEYERAEKDGCDTRMAIWARVFEKTRKLALLYADSENCEAPVITIEAMKWAWAVASYQTKRMLFMAEKYVTDTDFEADCKLFIEVLSTWHNNKGEKPMPKWLVTRNLKWTERKFNDVFEALSSQEAVEMSFENGKPLFRLIF